MIIYELSIIYNYHHTRAVTISHVPTSGYGREVYNLMWKETSRILENFINSIHLLSMSRLRGSLMSRSQIEFAVTLWWQVIYAGLKAYWNPVDLMSNSFVNFLSGIS